MDMLFFGIGPSDSYFEQCEGLLRVILRVVCFTNETDQIPGGSA